jgi:thymidylate kinase
VKRLRPAYAGTYILLAGPDGAGKSTLVRHLTEFGTREFEAVLTMHWRPGLLPSLGRVAGIDAPNSAQPHDRPPYGQAVSLVRLIYYWVDQVAGYWLRVWPCARRGGLVIMERGYWDILVDPRRYRLGCSPWIVRLLGVFVPRPHLTVILDGDPAIIAARKNELSAAEVARQLRRWRQFAPGRSLLLDGLLSENEIHIRVAQQLRGAASSSAGAAHA